MDFYKDFPERSDAGTATTPDGGVVAGSDKLNDNDYALVGANGTGSNSQGKGYKVRFLSIWNWIKGKMLTDGKCADSNKLDGSLASSFLRKDENNSLASNSISYHYGIVNSNFYGTSVIFNALDNSCLQLVSSNNNRLAYRVRNVDSGNWGDLREITSSAVQTTLASFYIAERYSIDEEQALTRRMIAGDPTVVEQFEAYNAYCEECKTRAKEELANQPQVLPADSLDAQQ